MPGGHLGVSLRFRQGRWRLRGMRAIESEHISARCTQNDSENGEVDIAGRKHGLGQAGGAAGASLTATVTSVWPVVASVLPTFLVQLLGSGTRSALSSSILRSGPLPL